MAPEQGQQADQAKRWGEIVAQAWTDPWFKERLLAQPTAVLREHGISVPAGTGVKLLRVLAQPAAVLWQRGGPAPGSTDLKLLESSDRMPTWTVILPTGPSQAA
jgi:hypothetical protein